MRATQQSWKYAVGKYGFVNSLIREGKCFRLSSLNAPMAGTLCNRELAELWWWGLCLCGVSVGGGGQTKAIHICTPKVCSTLMPDTSKILFQMLVE